MKKLLLIVAISASAIMADVSPKDDLLSVATAGKTTGTQFEMGKEQMKDADGGYYSYRGIGSSYYNSNTSAGYSSASSSRIYARTFGSYYWGRSW